MFVVFVVDDNVNSSSDSFCHGARRFSWRYLEKVLSLSWPGWQSWPENTCRIGKGQYSTESGNWQSVSPLAKVRAFVDCHCHCKIQDLHMLGSKVMSIDLQNLGASLFLILDAQELVHAMLAVDPSKRLTTHQILSHQVCFLRLLTLICWRCHWQMPVIGQGGHRVYI